MYVKRVLWIAGGGDGGGGRRKEFFFKKGRRWVGGRKGGRELRV
jgi:hypothetical protein